MIGLSKFSSLPPENQLRKLRLWLRALSVPVRHDQDLPGPELLARFVSTGLEGGDWHALVSRDLVQALEGLLAAGIATADAHRLHEVDLLFARDLGIEAAEWDLEPARRPPLGPGPGLMVYCENLRSPFNVGSVFRSAEAFGFSRVLLSPACPRPEDSPRLLRSAMGACDRIPHTVGELPDLVRRLDPSGQGLPVFALELGGTSLTDFVFPRTGIVVLGSEELGMKPATLALCRASAGVATIALHGTKASLNVGVSFGILACSWSATLKP